MSQTGLWFRGSFQKVKPTKRFQANFPKFDTLENPLRQKYETPKLAEHSIFNSTPK